MLRTLALLGIFLLTPLTLSAQSLPDPALQAAIAAGSDINPALRNPLRWEFEILLPTADSALSCPLVPGVQLAEQRTPYIVTLYDAQETPYVVHVAGDGSRVQRCDAKFPNMGMTTTSLLPATTAADACVVTPSGPFANVRAQPVVEAPQTAEISEQRAALGRNEDFTWYLVAEGWVAGTVVNATGNCLSNDLSIRDVNIATALVPQTDEGTALPPVGTTATPALTPADFMCPEGFVGYLPPRIQTGEVTAQVELGGLPNTIRTLPSTDSEQVGTVQPGRRLDAVLSGPRCSDGFVWWEIEVDGVRGWTAESSAELDSYFIAPTPGNEVAAPGPGIGFAPGEVITASNAAALQIAGRPPGRAAALTAFTPETTFYYVSTNATGASILYRKRYGDIRVQEMSSNAAGYTAITLGPGDLYTLGTGDGQISFFDKNGNLQPGASGREHNSPVNVIAFNADERVIATGSGSADTPSETWTLRLWNRAALENNAEDARLRSIRFPYPVTDVAFSTDGSYMAVVAQQIEPEPAAAVWIYADGGLGDNILSDTLPDAGTAFVTAGPNNGFLYSRGNRLLRLDPATGEERRLLTVEGTTVLRSAALSPVDATTLAVSGDSGFSVYNFSSLVSQPLTDTQFSVTGEGAGTVVFGEDGRTLTFLGIDRRVLYYAVAGRG